MSRWAPWGAAAGLVLAWVLAQGGNDGLWYQGDSPRHFMNGVFWGDFLAGGDYLDPHGFAMAYYLRFPAIAPTIWPPFVYLLEALAFLVTGPSIPVARGLVVLFALLGAVYLVALMGRWSRTAAGPWIGLLAVAQPVYLLWSGAVMMEIPALALGVASVFHLDRARATPGLRDTILAALFLWACTMTRLVGILVPASYGLWLLLSGEWGLLRSRTRILVWILAGLGLVPWLVVNLKFGSIMVREATHLGEFARGSLENWLYYPSRLPAVVGPGLLVLAAVGVLVGLAERETRRTAGVLLGCAVTTWLVLSWISLKEARYLLGILPFLAGAGALALDWVARALGTSGRAWVVPTLALAISGLAVGRAVSVESPRLSGMEAAVDQVLGVAPGDRILYDGLYDGVFVAYTRVHPDAGPWSVVRGSKVFYATALQARFGLVENATDAASLEAIVRDAGCRWLILEREEVVGIPAAALVRRVLADHASFRRVLTLPLSTYRLPEVTALDVYEYSGPLGDDLEGRLSFPVLGGVEDGH